MKNWVNNNIWITIVLVLIIGVVLGRFMFGSSSTSTATKPHEEVEHNHVDADEIWTCSMHPQIQLGEPGSCPICGMDLILLDQSSTTTLDENAIKMSSSALRLAEIETLTVAVRTPSKELRLMGKVKPDERYIYTQSAHVSGRIERLYVNFTGEKVVVGQKLASIYSPELVNAQSELFEVLKDKNTNPKLVEAARNKLKIWKFTDAQIEVLENTGEIQTELDILSDHNGFVMQRNVANGDHVMEGQSLFKIIDLSRIWVNFEAYENDLSWINIGDNIAIDFKAFPGKVLHGKVSFIDPFIDPETRVANVRVELKNSDLSLKPEMFARGTVMSKISGDEPKIVIPKSAILWTGKRSVVYVKKPNSVDAIFTFREVVLGEDAGSYYVIISGLREGEEIATNGVFKIDAAAQLAGKKSMMNDGE